MHKRVFELSKFNITQFAEKLNFMNCELLSCNVLVVVILSDHKDCRL